MAFLLIDAGSNRVLKKGQWGHKDYPPDKGGKSFHYRNCRIKQQGEGRLGTYWECDMLDPSKIWIPVGQPSPYPIGDDPTRNCRQMLETSYRAWDGRRKPGHYSYCAYGMVADDLTSSELVAARAACAALSEGQQLRDQPYGIRWRHKDVKRAAPGSPGDRFYAYPRTPVKGDLRLTCYFKDPLPSKDRPFQERKHARLLASGARFLTEAEKEQYASKCPAMTSSTGVEVPRKPVWKKKTDYFPFNPMITRTDIVEGRHELRCYPDLSGIEVQIDPRLTVIRQQEAFALASQRTAEEEVELEQQRQEVQEYLQRGEEPEHPWHVRYRIPLMLLGGMIVLGGGAALIQRMTAKRASAPSAPRANPIFHFHAGMDGLTRVIKIKAPTMSDAKKIYDRKYRKRWGPAYVKPAKRPRGIF